MFLACGNTGIGKETIKVLLQRNAKVYLAARNKEKAEAALVDLKAATGREAYFLELDLASLPSVRRAAHDCLRLDCSTSPVRPALLTCRRCSKETELHILFNNA